jgi:hypothetical protein
MAGPRVKHLLPRRPSVAVEAVREPFPLAARLVLNLDAQPDLFRQSLIAHTLRPGSPIGFGVSHVNYTNYTAKNAGVPLGNPLRRRMTTGRLASSRPQCRVRACGATTV